MKKIIEKFDDICNYIVCAFVKYIFPIIIAILLLGNLLFENSDNKTISLIITFIFLWIICYFLWKSASKETETEYRKYLVKKLRERDIENANNDKPKGNDTTDTDNIIELMLKNHDESTEYFKISKSQIKNSFRLSVASCIAGLVFLGFGIYNAMSQKDISVSVISLISGSISELVSGTVFWIHNKSALQFNHYYDKLHENEQFLSAINIADNLSNKKREEALVEIIHKQINSETSKIKTESIKGKGKNKQDKHKIDK